MSVAGKRILVTRSPHQASELADGLRAAGMETISIPTIKIMPLSSYTELDEALSDLGRFGWAIFTSANAVEVFGSRFGGAVPEGVKVAAIGPATARALASIGVGIDLVPETAVAESLAGALLPYAAQGERFLLVRAEVGREVLPSLLRRAGGEVVVAPAYRTVVPASSVARLRALDQDWPEVVTFTSSSSVENFGELLREAKVALPEGVLTASIGPVTSGAMRMMGMRVDVEASSASVGDLVRAVVRLFAD